ncbi:hypothetical protein L2D01_04420 [Hyphomonadaceae bacterium ML37]|nr:hypothetical protein L2D01_04420 [Hyphomonadaceae bacterium ML37]
MNMHSTTPSKAKVKVADWSLWIKHVSGNPALAEHLASLKAGETITLVVGGYQGVWERKADGKDGRPTLGLKPLSDGTRKAWFALYGDRKGQLVDIALGQSEAALRARAKAPGPARKVSSLEPASPADQEAAWAAFTALRSDGWRFDPAQVFDRAALHERGAGA